MEVLTNEVEGKYNFVLAKYLSPKTCRDTNIYYIYVHKW